MNLITGADLDDVFAWPMGRADRLARRGRLAHVVLPDGSIRFHASQIEDLLKKRDVETTATDVAGGGHRHENDVVLNREGEDTMPKRKTRKKPGPDDEWDDDEDPDEEFEDDDDLDEDDLDPDEDEDENDFDDDEE